jgi:hypothetical protein
MMRLNCARSFRDNRIPKIARACAAGARPLVEALEERQFLSAVVATPHARHTPTPLVASVTTDKSDYRPGERAKITGPGYRARENVRLQVLHTDGTPDTAPQHRAWVVQADAHGIFQTSYPVGSDDLNTTMELTAVGLSSGRSASETFTDASAIVRPDHIVVVIEEDRASGAIGDTAHMPYFNQLAASGLVYSNSHGVAHPSLPDYLALYSGSTQGITDNGNNHTFTAPNIAKSLNSTLLASGQYLSFAGYTESLPRDGDTTTRIAGDPNDPSAPPDLYMRNYSPMAQFTDVGAHGSTLIPNAAVNKTFASFPTTAAGYAALPTVSFVIPNNLHNTHGSNEQPPYATEPSEYDFLRSSADTWLKQHLDGYLQWAKANNSLLIVTTDEEETDSTPTSSITTIVNGDPNLVVRGVNATSFNHYNVLRTIEDMYGLTPLGVTGTVSPLTTNSLGQLSFPGQEQGPSTSTTVLTSSASTTYAGQTVTFTATVTVSATPTGTVTFQDGTTVLGAGTLDASGKARFSTSALAIGQHSITAVYGGDAKVSASTSAALTETIRPANDNFASRTVFSGTLISATGTNAFATKESGEPSHAGNSGGKSVWYRWTAPGDGKVTIDTTGSDFDTLLAVYKGTSVSALSAVSGGSNNNDPAGGTLTSKVSFSVTAGTTYQIAVDGYNGASGQIALHLNLASTAPAAPTGVAATDGAYTDRVRITWTASTGATGYEVWRGTSSSSGSATKISTADVTTTAYDDTSATSGTTYYYWVKANNAAGTSPFSASNTGYRAVSSSTAPVNDNFANRTQLSGTSVTATGASKGATKEAGEPNHGGNTGGKSVWWTWSAPTSGTLTIDTSGSNFDTLLGVYTGSSVSALTLVPGGSNDDNPSGGTTTSKVTIAVTAGTTYQIAVDGYNGVYGLITLHLNLV